MSNLSNCSKFVKAFLELQILLQFNPVYLTKTKDSYKTVRRNKKNMPICLQNNTIYHKKPVLEIKYIDKEKRLKLISNS